MPLWILYGFPTNLLRQTYASFIRPLLHCAQCEFSRQKRKPCTLNLLSLAIDHHLFPSQNRHWPFSSCCFVLRYLRFIQPMPSQPLAAYAALLRMTPAPFCPTHNSPCIASMKTPTEQSRQDPTARSPWKT